MKSALEPSSLKLSSVSGVGSAAQKALGSAELHTVLDLLLHLPLRYEDRTTLTPINQLITNQTALVEGLVIDTASSPKRYSVWIQDHSGSLELVFFKVYKGLTTQFSVGSRVRVFGQVKQFGGQYSMAHAQKVSQNTQPSGYLQPVYPKVTGLSNPKLITLIRSALALCKTNTLHDPAQAVLAKLPKAKLNQVLADSTKADTHQSFDLPQAHTQTKAQAHKRTAVAQPNFDWSSLLSALEMLHKPPVGTPPSQLQLAKLRLELDELCAHQLTFLKLRQEVLAHKAPRFNTHSALVDQLKASLPFELTSAQLRVWQQIQADVTSSAPMHRLLQGDVGSGKTLVAALSVLLAYDSGFSSALMAPTEILARQHAQNLSSLFEPLGVKTVLLTGSLSAAERKEALSILKNELAVAVGTHALFQADVFYTNFGLAVVDEQHRFGVNERLALRNKASGALAHMLALSATPIPRTLAMSHFGDMQTSVLDEKPPGRTPVQTALVSLERKTEVVQRLVAALKDGAQAYWVCPLVEDSEHISAAAAEAVYSELKQHPEFGANGLKVALVHGKTKTEVKQQVMQAFSDNQVQLLVATTVIEVGVDVANASIMVIENPERLGLSQLHQLRGRVGRGSAQSSCVLLYGKDVSAQGIERLCALRNSTDGFELAQIDLLMRGPGELFGSRQAGDLGYKVAKLNNPELVELAHELARCIDPNQQQVLIERWQPATKMADA